MTVLIYINPFTLLTSTMTDIEIVERFYLLHGGSTRRRIPSIHGYRSEMLKLAPRLYKILLDGLAAKAADTLLQCGHTKSEE